MTEAIHSPATSPIKISETVDPDRLHAGLRDLLPTEAALVLDVSAGSGPIWGECRRH